MRRQSLLWTLSIYNSLQAERLQQLQLSMSMLKVMKLELRKQLELELAWNVGLDIAQPMPRQQQILLQDGLGKARATKARAQAVWQ